MYFYVLGKVVKGIRTAFDLFCGTLTSELIIKINYAYNLLDGKRGSFLFKLFKLS